MECKHNNCVDHIRNVGLGNNQEVQKLKGIKVGL